MFLLNVTEFGVHHDKLFDTACGSSTHLRSLADAVPDVLAEARASSTTEAYRGAYQKWLTWAKAYTGIVSLPATPHSVVLYLMQLSKHAITYSSINLAVSAISWGHSLAGLVSPTHDILVVEFLKGLKYRLAKPKSPKEPFSLKHIQQFMDIMLHTSLTDLRNTCIIVLCFYAFLRFDELVNIKVKHVVFYPSHLTVFIERAKNDQLREGNQVCVARLTNGRCPVALLETYFRTADCAQKTDYFLFRRIITVQGSKFLWDKNIKLTYNTVRSVVREKCSQIGLDAKQFGTHSMRSGGSTAAANAGIGDRVFQRHGRWASSAAKDGYVKDGLNVKLAVTLALQ
jgi:integrase